MIRVQEKIEENLKKALLLLILHKFNKLKKTTTKYNYKNVFINTIKFIEKTKKEISPENINL